MTNGLAYCDRELIAFIKGFMLKLLVGVAKSFLILLAACAAKSGEMTKMKIVLVIIEQVSLEQVASNKSSLILLIQI
jgi:hypothetical protein